MSQELWGTSLYSSTMDELPTSHRHHVHTTCLLIELAFRGDSYRRYVGWERRPYKNFVTNMKKVSSHTPLNRADRDSTSTFVVVFEETCFQISTNLDLIYWQNHLNKNDFWHNIQAQHNACWSLHNYMFLLFTIVCHLIYFPNVKWNQ